MKRLGRFAAFVFVVSVFGSAWAEGDAGLGATKAITCTACHGPEGKALLPVYPNIGGQNYRYLLSQLRAMKAYDENPQALGSRNPGLMIGQLAAFDDQDLQDLAAHFARQSPYVGEAVKEKALLGEAIYRGGIMDKKVAACTACHSPRGSGNAPAGFPRLSGQGVDYTIQQLKSYREGLRTTDEDYGGTMRQIAARLTDTEIERVAQYLHGVH